MQRGLNPRLAVLRILAAGTAITIALNWVPVRAQERPPGSNFRSGVQILSSRDGVDFQPYVIALLTTTRRKWMEKPQDEAMLGEKDLVVIHVTVRKDGTFEQPPTIETASKNGPFDDAALEAVRASAPFDPLPKSFSRPDLELRLVFSYKHSPSLRLLGVFPRPVVRSTPVRSNG